MAEYEYDSGLRQTLLNNTTKKLLRLDDYVNHDKSESQKKVREGLKQFYNSDIMAAYATNPAMHIPNNYLGCLFVRGILDNIGPNEYDLIFKGPSGIIRPQGITYKGNSWIVPIDQLIEALKVEDYKANPNPLDREYVEKEFEFGTMSELSIGKVQAYEPFGAFLKIIDQYKQLRKELSENRKTTPIKLMSISDIKPRGSGTGTGMGA